MRETATRTLEIIAQTQALMAQVDAATARRVVSVAPPVIVAPRRRYHLPSVGVPECTLIAS
jgi:hypothetical protein